MDHSIPNISQAYQKLLDQLAARNGPQTSLGTSVGINFDPGRDSHILATLGTWDILKIIDSLGIFSLTRFNYFPLLPVEIRSMIWKWALVEETSRRVVFFETHSHRIVNLEHAVSPLLSANRQSRLEATSFYELRLEVHKMPRMILNFDYPREEEWVDRVLPDGTVQRMKKQNLTPRDDVVGAVYISPIRDTFVPITQEYNKDDRPLWILLYHDRLVSARLSKEVRGKVRRVLRVCELDYLDERGVPAKRVPTLDLISVTSSLLRDIQYHWLSKALPGLRHHGVVYFPRPDHMIMKGSRRQQFVFDLRRGGDRSVYKVRKFLQRNEKKTNGLSWEFALAEDFVSLRPYPVQNFELTTEDMEGLVGEF